MSTKSPKQTSALRSDIEAIFRKVEASGFQPRLRTVAGTCEFDLEGGGIWRVVVKEGTVIVIEGTSPVPSATCFISCAAEDFLRIVHQENHMNMMAAVLQEILSIKGDIAFAYAALGSFVLAPSGASSQQGIRSR